MFVRGDGKKGTEFQTVLFFSAGPFFFVLLASIFCRHRMSYPARKDEADWLVELTGDVGNDYRTDIEAGGDKGLMKAPVTAQEFHARWRESEAGKAIDQVRR